MRVRDQSMLVKDLTPGSLMVFDSGLVQLVTSVVHNDDLTVTFSVIGVSDHTPIIPHVTRCHRTDGWQHPRLTLCIEP